MPGSTGEFAIRKPTSAAYATPAPVLFFDEADGTFVGGNFLGRSRHGARLGSPSAEQAAKGLALYEGKALCSACHPNEGPKALFTDYTYDNIGVPPNPLNPARIANPAFRDLGLGGFMSDPSFDGAQKVPTLRNLDKRVAGGAKGYVHNGVLKTLAMVGRFYNTRDVLGDCATKANPKMGENCWPLPEVQDNVNVDELGNLGLTYAERGCSGLPQDADRRSCARNS